MTAAPEEQDLRAAINRLTERLDQVEGHLLGLRGDLQEFRERAAARKKASADRVPPPEPPPAPAAAGPSGRRCRCGKPLQKFEQALGSCMDCWRGISKAKVRS